MICEQHFRIKKNGEPTSICYCRNPEKIENYAKAVADTSQTWQVHHRREEFYSRKELIERGEYFDVSPEELIFLTVAEHHKIDFYCKRMSKAKKGMTLSEEHKKKIGEAHKGKLINRKDLSKRVLCIETKEIFESTMDAQRKTGIFQNNISAVCNGKYKSAGGYHWKYFREEKNNE